MEKAWSHSFSNLSGMLMLADARWNRDSYSDCGKVGSFSGGCGEVWKLYLGSCPSNRLIAWTGEEMAVS